MKKQVLLGLAAVLWCLPAFSQAETLDELLVKKGIISQSEAEALKQEADDTKLSWDRGLKIENKELGFASTIFGKLRANYVYTDNDDASTRGDVSSFDVTNARLGSFGIIRNGEFKYRFEGEFAGTSGNDLLDGFVDWAKYKQFEVRAGQWKTPISRQFFGSVSTRQFYDNAIPTDLVNFGYRPGINVQTALAEGKLLLGASLRNGDSTGEGQSLPGVDTKEAGFIYTRWAALGKMDPFEEGDVVWTEAPAVSVGAAYATQKDKITNITTSESFNRDVNAVSADVNFKYVGMSVHSEYYWRRNEVIGGNEAEMNGFYIQGGYFFIPKKLEAAARYAMADCDSGTFPGRCVGVDTINQATAGLNYFIWGQSLKAQLNYDYIMDDMVEGEDLSTNRWLAGFSAWW